MGRRAQIALRWQWAKVADIFEEQVVEPLGPFQWETYREQNLVVMHVLHESYILLVPTHNVSTFELPLRS